ncbi:hypothetical protein ACFO4O_09580 [Glaciecola siphonariae]|uniref:Uncharacterized protein n=1 Tax=Glaciecola siphonariae TaxID=521012 RepID=A0ABV9LV67_9ALTE
MTLLLKPSLFALAYNTWANYITASFTATALGGASTFAATPVSADKVQ